MNTKKTETMEENTETGRKADSALTEKDWLDILGRREERNMRLEREAEAMRRMIAAQAGFIAKLMEELTGKGKEG